MPRSSRQLQILKYAFAIYSQFRKPTHACTSRSVRAVRMPRFAEKALKIEEKYKEADSPATGPGRPKPRMLCALSRL